MRLLVAPLLIAALATETSAAVLCLKPAEARAEKLRLLQTEFMVAALKCGHLPGYQTRDLYNQLVVRHRTELQTAMRTMESHFKRTSKSGYRSQFDRHSTAIANAMSAYAQGTPGFCPRIETLAFRAATETLPGSLTSLFAETPELDLAASPPCPQKPKKKGAKR